MLAEATRGSIDEAYQGAVSSSNLRVGNDHTLPTPGDVTAAAGMNRHRTGLALLRLQTEWGIAARPVPPTRHEIDALAESYAIEGPTYWAKVKLTDEQQEAAKAQRPQDEKRFKTIEWIGRLQLPNPHAGKVRVEHEDGREEFLLPAKLAKRTRWEWYHHEVKLVLMTMRTLPGLRDSLLAHASKQEWGCDAHAVAQVLLWWLSPKCTVCGGNKEEVVAGTGRTNGKVCPHCKGTGKENRGDPPCGKRGVLLSGYINSCLQAARRELREGVYRERRTMAGESSRGERLKPLRRAKESPTLAPDTAHEDAGDSDRKGSADNACGLPPNASSGSVPMAE